MWQCKGCGSKTSTRCQLIKHYRLKHPQYGRRHPYPCPYTSCPCTFKSWNALRSHLCRVHKRDSSQRTLSLATFRCQVCAFAELGNDKQYFSHINLHLKSHETISCMFKDCTFTTNIYGTFKSHKNRKHLVYSYSDFKPGIVTEKLETVLKSQAFQMNMKKVQNWKKSSLLFRQEKVVRRQ